MFIAQTKSIKSTVTFFILRKNKTIPSIQTGDERTEKMNIQNKVKNVLKINQQNHKMLTRLMKVEDSNSDN